MGAAWRGGLGTRFSFLGVEVQAATEEKTASFSVFN